MLGGLVGCGRFLWRVVLVFGFDLGEFGLDWMGGRTLGD
jgi:hypothetical protein